MAETLHDAALAYVARGWSIFPLVTKDKIPAVPGGFKAATTDADQIGQTWEALPNLNIGIATGSASRGLVVIDLDVHSDDANGLDVLHEWENMHGELPETVTAITGSGGMHLFFQCNTPIACSVGTGDYAGVDIRGDGGYVVAPPSVHPNGTAYAWENDPEDYTLAKADDNVYAFIGAVQGGQRRSERFKLPDTITAGKRNDTLMRYAASMQSRGDDDVLILSALEAANKLKCKPPVPQEELEKIVQSVTTHYEKGNATVPPRSVSLMLSPRGGPLQTIENAGRALDADPALAGRFRYNEVAYTRMVQLPVPWDNHDGERPINDADNCGLAAYLEREYGLMSKQKAIDAVTNVAMRNRCNPIVEWLDSLVWDGEERISTLLSCYLGCDPSDYNMTVMRLFMQGAVARAYKPGTKFDYMPVLIGRQGIGKSMFLRRLGHNSNWYCDNFNTVEGDAAAEKLRGMWIVELAELLATKKQRDVESIKAFLTSTVDTIRPKYARETEQRPRACVFAGTTNSPQFLSDSTGNRRFLPVECGVHEPVMSLFADGVEDYFEQAWAEAVHIYKTEHPVLVLNGLLAEYALEKQEAYTEDDPRVGIIQAYLDQRLETEMQKSAPDLWRVRVCVQELVDDALPKELQKTQGPFLTNSLHTIMQTKIHGWIKYPRSTGKARCGTYGIQRCYVPEEVLDEG